MADWKQDYIIIKELGFGRTSTVYLAEHAKFGRVALKVLHSGAKDTRTPDGRRVSDRFLEERLILLELRQALKERGISEDHVPNFFESGSGEQPFIALSLAPGMSADKMLLEEENRAGLPEPIAIAMIARFVAILETLHKGLRRTYTDVQLDNLFWQPDLDGEPGEGHLTVIDWNVVSSPLPEQPTPDQQADFDQRVLRDITLCGVFLLRLLTRQLAPLSGIPLADLNGMERWAELSRGTRDLISGLLSLDPEQRICQDAAELKARLNSIEYWWNAAREKDAQRMVQKFEERYQAAQGDKEQLFAWALEVDALLPIFEQRKLLDLAMQKKLAARVGDLVRNPVAMMGKGRIYFDGTRYANAVEEFSRAERAGLGLTALRWRLLAGLARRELDAETNGNFGGFKNRLVEAVEALEARRWDHPALATDPEAPVLHAYFAWEAQIRHALEAGNPQQAYAFETDQLNRLPDPLEPGSGDVYRRALRAETGDLGAQAQEAAQSARLADARQQHREALNEAWGQYRAATDDKSLLFETLIEILTRTLSGARGDAEWLALAQGWAKTLADESLFADAKTLLEIALDHSLNISLDLHREHRLVALLQGFQSQKDRPELFSQLAETASLHLPVFRQSSALRQHQLFENLFQAWQESLRNPALRQTALRLRAILQQVKPAWNPREEETIAQARQLLQEDKLLQAQQLLNNLPEEEMPENWHRLWGEVNQQVNQALEALTPENSDADKRLLEWLVCEPGQKKLLDTAFTLAIAWFAEKRFKPMMAFIEAVCPYASPSNGTPATSPSLPCEENRLDRLYHISQWVVQVIRLEEKHAGDLLSLVKNRPVESQDTPVAEQSPLSEEQQVFQKVLKQTLQDVLKVKIETFIVREWNNRAIRDLIGLAEFLPEKSLQESLRARQKRALEEDFVTHTAKVGNEITIHPNLTSLSSIPKPAEELLAAVKLDAELLPAYQAHVERILFTEHDLPQAREDLRKVYEMLGDTTPQGSMKELMNLAQTVDQVLEAMSLLPAPWEDVVETAPFGKESEVAQIRLIDQNLSHARDDLIKVRRWLDTISRQEDLKFLPRAVDELLQIFSLIPGGLGRDGIPREEPEASGTKVFTFEEKLDNLSKRLDTLFKDKTMASAPFSSLFVSLWAKYLNDLSNNPPTKNWIGKFDEFLQRKILNFFQQDLTLSKKLETAWKNLLDSSEQHNIRPYLLNQLKIAKEKFYVWYQTLSPELQETEGKKLAWEYHRRFMAILVGIGAIEFDTDPHRD